MCDNMEDREEYLQPLSETLVKLVDMLAEEAYDQYKEDQEKDLLMCHGSNGAVIWAPPAMGGPLVKFLQCVLAGDEVGAVLAKEWLMGVVDDMVGVVEEDE